MMFRKIVAIVVMMSGTFIIAQGQLSDDDLVVQLQHLYKENALLADNTLRYNADSRMMELSGHLIRVTDDTHVKADKDKTDPAQKHRVVFSCQNNTSIIHKDRPGEKHAWVSVPLKSKKACAEFVDLFDALKLAGDG